MLIRSIKLYQYLLQYDPCDTVDDSFLDAFIKAKLRLWPDTNMMKNIKLNLVHKITTQYLNLGSVFGDECINHNTHLWTAGNNDNKAKWSKTKFWQFYWEQVWLKKVTNDKVISQNMNSIYANIVAHFVKHAYKPPVLKLIFDWIMQLKLHTQLSDVQKQKMPISQVKVSPSMYAWFAILSKTLRFRNLCSQIKQGGNKSKYTNKNKSKNSIKTKSKPKTHIHPRNYTLPETAEIFIQTSLTNTNGLMYQLIFNVWNDETNDIAAEFANGITPEMDCPIPIVAFTTNVQLQWCFVNNLSVLTLKFLMWYEMIGKLIKGALKFDIKCLHAAIQEIYLVIGKLLDGHYYYQSTRVALAQPERRSLRSNQNTNSKLRTPINRINATLSNAKLYKSEQCKIIYKHNTVNSNIKNDKVFDSVFCFDKPNKLWTNPPSAAWVLFTPTTIKNASSKLAHTQVCEKKK